MSAGSKTTSPLTSGEWRPGADLAALRARAEMLAAVRAYFAYAGVLEVETPLACASAGTDPSLQPMRAHYRGPLYPKGVDLYLQTSPEFAMKRLLAAGTGAIYQICKAFRDGEAGRLHNPEFSILEWYRPGFGLGELMREVEMVIGIGLGMDGLTVEQVPYAELFHRELGLDLFATDQAGLRALAIERNILGAEALVLDRDGWLDLLFSYLIQPRLGHPGLTFVTGYPASQAALARLQADGRTAARFEVFHRGIELANGFHELVDADEQAARFEADNCRRRAARQQAIKVDRRLLAAMQSGLPDCAGVAVGLDRLLMLRQGADELDAVISFSLQRA